MSDNASQLSMLEALSMAGGAAKTAKLGHARLLRKADHSETQISLGDIQKGKHPDFAMAPGDILYVPFSYTKTCSSAALPALLEPRQPLRSMPHSSWTLYFCRKYNAPSKRARRSPLLPNNEPKASSSDYAVGEQWEREFLSHSKVASQKQLLI